MRISIFRPILLAGAAMSTLVTFAACSSSTSTYSATNCPSIGISSNSSCASCLNSSCKSQVTAANQSCSSSFSCACPPNADATKCSISSGCESDAMNLVTCADQSCASECSSVGSGSSSGGSGSSGSSGGISSGSSGGGSTGPCNTVNDCPPAQYAGASQVACVGGVCTYPGAFCNAGTSVCGTNCVCPANSSNNGNGCVCNSGYQLTLCDGTPCTGAGCDPDFKCSPVGGSSGSGSSGSSGGGGDAFTTACMTYYNDWFANGSGCNTCVTSHVTSCSSLQQSGSCSSQSLSACETQCGGSSSVNNAPNCACIEQCLGSCASVTQQYYSCEIASCGGC